MYSNIINNISVIFIMLIITNLIVFIIALYKGFNLGLVSLSNIIEIRKINFIDILKKRKYFGLQEITVAAIHS